MNTKNLLIASLAGGVAISLLTNVPFLNLVNCLLCAGFWGGAIFAVWLYRRLTGTLTVKDGVIIGLCAGAVAGVLGLIFSFAGWSGAPALMNNLAEVVPAQDLPDLTAVAGGLSIMITLVGVLFTIALGTLGGWIGGAIFKQPK